MEPRFAGRRAIVTGGASGIGKAVAKQIVQEGGAVALWDLNVASLKTARSEVGASYTYAVNVADAGAVAATAAQTVSELGGVDILITCAGVLGDVRPIEETSDELWRRVLSVNLDGVFYCCRAIVPHLRNQGYGRIVTLSSVVGKEGVPGSSAYAASKAGVIGLTKTLGKELATVGVLINSVTPGFVSTPMTAAFPPEVQKMIIESCPIGRAAIPEECAEMICFMASEQCSFTTGGVFDLSGGRADY